jgi:type VII secretion protein EccE
MSERRYRFGSLEKRTLIGPFGPSQVAILGVGAALGLLCLYATHSLIGLALAIIALGLAAASITVPFDGRTLAEWAPVVLRWRLRRRTSREGYRSTAASAGIRVGSEESHEVSLPPELGQLDLLSAPYGAETVGVIRDGSDGTYTAAMAVKAGAFALRDPEEQSRALDAWGGALASCAREGSALRRLQWIERTMPGQGDDLASYLQEKRDRSVPLTSSVVTSYIELLEAAAPVTQEHEVLIALQIDTRRAGRELKRFGGGDEGACALLLREAEGLAQRLSTAEINVFGLLRPRQYAEVVRDCFDPFGHQARARAAIGDASREGVDPALMGPYAEETGWSHYRTDSAVHVTYWVSSMPRSDVGPTFLAPLLMQSSMVRTVSVTMEPIPFATAMRKAEMASTQDIAEEMSRRDQGFLTTARDRRQQEAVSRREEELSSGYAEMRFVPFVTVSALPGDLEQAKGEIEHAAQLARLELQPMYGEQDSGFTNTLPLCRGLR